MAHFLLQLIPYGLEDFQIVEDHASLPTEIQLLEALGEKCETVRRGSLKKKITATIIKFMNAKDLVVTDANSKMDHSTIRFQSNAGDSKKKNLPEDVFTSQDTIPPKPQRGSSAGLNASSTEESSCTADTSDLSSDASLHMAENGNSTTFSWWETLKLLDDEEGDDLNERSSQQRFYRSDSNLDFSSFPPRKRDAIPLKPLRSNSSQSEGIYSFMSCADTTILPLWQRTERGLVESVQPTNSSPLGSVMGGIYSISQEKLDFLPAERIVYNHGGRAHESESSKGVLGSTSNSFPSALPNSKGMRTRGEEGKHVLMASGGKDPSMALGEKRMYFLPSTSHKCCFSMTEYLAGSFEARIGNLAASTTRMPKWDMRVEEDERHPWQPMHI